MREIFDLTAKRAELMPDKAAFVDAVAGASVTYAALDDRAGRAAALLRDLGVAEGERIAILCHNNVAFFEVLFGCAKAGVILVPLNWRQTPAELVSLLDDCGARLLLHDEATAELAGRLAAERDLPRLSIAPGGDYETRRDATAPIAGRRVWPTDATWVLLYTSGTTGTPKAVIQTVGMALANAINIGQPIDLTSRDATLNFLPLFHTAGINLYTLPVLIAGGTVHVMPKFDVDRLAELIAAGALTCVFGVPAIYQALSLHERFETLDLTRVRSWGCGGAPMPDALQDAYAARGVEVCNGFGMTETGPTVFLMDPEHAATKRGSVGKPQLLVDIRIVDRDGGDVAPGADGELLIKGPGVTPGYWNRPAATAEAIDANGWLHSGDMARRDADGYVFIVGRIKDMYISGGENVYPAEVENVLALHPQVLEAAVVGVPDAKWGEVGRAYVLPRDGATADAADLIAFCRERLAAYKVPKSVVLVDDFPRTAAGKVQKHLLPVPEET